MKKLVLFAALALIALGSCKKEENKSPLPPPPTSPGYEVHFFYHWSYDAPAGVMHNDSACISTDSMHTLQTTIGAYNVNQGVGC